MVAQVTNICRFSSILVLTVFLVYSLAEPVEQTEVDRPVPVERIHVLAGDKVELACDVSSWSDDEEGRFHYDQGSATLAPGFGSRSIHRQPAIKNNNKAGPSSSSSSRQRHYSGTWGHHGRLKRRYDHHDDGGEHDEEEKEGGYLVLWFIDPERKPFYSYDVRKGKAGRHWWDEQRFDKRVRFLLPSPAGSSSSSHVSRSAGIHQTSSTGLLPARLQIAGVTRQDAGDYRCRIDFNSAPSRNFKYRLVVIEPPNSVLILDGQQQQLTVLAGPLEEGGDLVLTCKALGGYPQPWVTWWQGGQLLDNVTDERTPHSVSNRLVIERIKRKNLHDAYTCQVTSSPHLAPIMKTVALELNLRPLFVEILLPGSSTLMETNRSRPLMAVADQTVEVKCRTAGSRPAPSITWWKGNKQVPSHLSTITNADDGNMTVSRLILTPKSEDDGSHLICRVKNSMISGSVVEESVKLDIHYPPEVRIALGSNINGDDVKEGDDLYIECHIRANPAFYKLQWTHNGVPLVHNVSAGVVLSNVSLVLRSVTHSRAGMYACSAANSRGETVSQPALQLRVQYAPRCRSVSAAGTVSGVSKQETASLDCQVDADPSSDVHFWWTFLGTPMKSNGSMLVTSSGDAILLPRSLFSSNGSASVLHYSPKSELDFGVVACWASNPVGNQREPCLFHVVPAGKPAAPSNCAIHNQTADSVRVDCQEAFDGGLQQTFGLELVDRNTRELRYVFNNTKPVFTVYGLEPETAFLLNIYALNAKGRSQPIVLETTTLRAAQKQTSPAFYFQMTPLLGVLVGTASTLLAIVLAVALVVHRRNRLKRRRQELQQHQQPRPPGANEHPSSAGSGTAAAHGQPLLPFTSSNDRAPQSADEQERRTLVINKNGHAQTYGAKVMNSPSINSGKDPDIILRDMDFQHTSRPLPAVMMNGTLTKKPRGQQMDDPSGAGLFRPESPRFQHGNSWNISPHSVGATNHGWVGTSFTTSLGHYAGNNGALMQQQPGGHNTAADLLADCRLPESSL